MHIRSINALGSLNAAPTNDVIVGSGKTATNGIVWLLVNGVPPDRIMWVRPRDGATRRFEVGGHVAWPWEGGGRTDRWDVAAVAACRV